MRRAFESMIAARLRWSEWEALVEANGIQIDRSLGSVHPIHPEIIYPINYGFVSNTLGTEGDELDVFVGSGKAGLVAAIFTTDYRRGDRECKLIYNCTHAEVYLVNGFINYDRNFMEGTLVMRHPLRSLWEDQQATAAA